MMTRKSRFGEALQSAIDKALEQDTPDIPAEHKARMFQELLDFYRAKQATIDLAIDGAVKLSASSWGASQVGRLEGTMRKDIAQVDGEVARGVLRSAELQPFVEAAQAQGVAAVSAGVSLGFDALVGVAAGLDALLRLDNDTMILRGWGIVDLGPDLFAGIGLNLGIWPALPTTDKKSYIGGLLLDVPLGPAIPVVIRIMVVQEGPGTKSSPSDFTLLGFTFAISAGKGGGLMVYRGVQYALAMPSRRAKLTVCNCTDGTNPCKPGTSSVPQNAVSTLVCTLENTSGKTITVASGGEMTIRMPSYFSSSDASSIQVKPPSGWISEGWNTNTVTLQYTGSSTLQWTDPLSITLMNVKPSKSSPTDGKVTVRIPDAEVPDATIDIPGVSAEASLTLVPSIKYATISKWTADFPNFKLIDGYPTSGTNVPATSQDDQNAVVPLTKVVDSNGKTWDLGYQFYVDDTTKQPCFRACWYQENTIPRNGSTLYGPNFVVLTTTGQDSTAYYSNVIDAPNYIKIISVALNP